MAAHLVELDDEAIKLIANGLAADAWQWSEYGGQAEDLSEIVAGKRLCERIEALLPLDVTRQVWPEGLKT